MNRLYLGVLDNPPVSVHWLEVTFTGFSLTFKIEGHWLVSRQVLCKTEDRRPEPLGGPGACSPGKFSELKSPRSAFSCNVEKKSLIFIITHT